MGTRDKEKARKQYQAWYTKNKDKKQKYDREWGMFTRYRVTPEQYLELFTLQNGVCAICGKPERMVDKRTGTFRNLSIDHCHTTGKVRGLLCSYCNHAIGKFNDDVTILQKAIKYLTSDV